MGKCKKIDGLTLFELVTLDYGKDCNQWETRLLENVQKNIAIMTFKNLNDLTLMYLQEFFQYSTSMLGYNTRSTKRKELFVSQKRNSWQIRAFKARAI